MRGGYVVVINTEAIAAGIRAERARADVTQEELAARLGTTKSTVSLWEGGSQIPGADKIYAIAQVLGCTPNDLFGWKGGEAR